IVERKTALLFSACCQVPPMLAARGTEEERALAAYGRDLGMAFQVVDDLLDLTSEEEKLGKPVGWDLRKGELTLPLVHLLRLGTARHRDLVVGVLSEGPLSESSRVRILEALSETGALQISREIAAGWAARARTHLDRFPPGPFRSALQQVAEFVV